MHYRVIDEQHRLEPQGLAEYHHVVRVVNDSAALATAGQIEIEFDPSFQTLAMHRLDIVRKGQRINRLDPQRIRVLQREKQLERQMIDGRKTFTAVLEDVRVGDEIDLAYTRRGANPVFGGRHVGSTWMGSDKGPVALYQVRLLAPVRSSVRLDLQGASEPESSVTGDWRETVIRRSALPKVGGDARTPPSAYLPHLVNYSDFADWEDVARWGRGLFADPGGARVQQEAARLMAAHAEPAARVLAALAIVQQDVRYFGTEMGASSHRPSPPDQVLQQRYGDCKDKVLLLVALLRRMGIDASPVLVSSGLRSEVQRLRPTPLAFDHVIARVRIGTDTWFLDATRAHQSGPLATRQAMLFGRGLVLEEGTQALAELPRPFEQEWMRVHDTLRLANWREPLVLESRVTYRAELAEGFRNAVAALSLQDLAKDFAEPYLRLYRNARALGPVTMEPAQDDDAVTFVQRYELPDYWRFQQERTLAGDLMYWSLAEMLAGQRGPARTLPLGIGFAGVYRHTVTLDLPEGAFWQPPSYRAEDGDRRVSLKIDAQGTKQSVSSTALLRWSVDRIEPAEWQDHMRRIERLLPMLSNTITVPTMTQAEAEEAKWRMKALLEDVGRGRLKAVTRTQAEAQVRTRMMQQHIGAGRMPAAIEAQARVRLGEDLDHLGDAEKARAEFERALQLAPESTEALLGSAMNAFLRRDLGGAEAFATQVLQKEPRNREALRIRGMARYFAQRVPEARQDFASWLDNDAARRNGYALLWTALAMKHSAQDPAALSSSAADERLPRDWPRPIVDFMLGRLDADALLKQARAANNTKETLSEAYFYLGEWQFAQGRKDLARKAWQQSVDQGVIEFVEDAAARLRLATAAATP
jgi:lipoprotein NlpI/transglutaminase-like putative cysteine protease